MLPAHKRIWDRCGMELEASVKTVRDLGDFGRLPPHTVHLVTAIRRHNEECWPSKCEFVE